MPPNARLKIWDLPVRIFHWSVATLFLLNYWVLEAGETLHEWAGYTVAGLLVLRVVWGFIGSRHARFSSFWPTPSRLRRHLHELRARRFDPAEGHNPLGALMILLLLVLLAALTITGWMQSLDRFWGEDWVHDLHAFLANSLMVLVAVHIVAVIAMSRISGLQLVRTMLAGWRSVPASDDTKTSSGEQA